MIWKQSFSLALNLDGGPSSVLWLGGYDKATVLEYNAKYHPTAGDGSLNDVASLIMWTPVKSIYFWACSLTGAEIGDT